MAVLKSIATGDFTAAATWGVVDSTSYNNTETTATNSTTTYQLSSTFTPGAIEISGIAVRPSATTATVMTISVALDQGGSTVAGTEVTINQSDLPSIVLASLNGGWHTFKFATPVTLAAATAYSVKIKASSSNQASFYATSGTNWARALITTTTQTPAAGDDLIIAGEYTGTGTSNSFTVTYDKTATTYYGSTPTASNSLISPGLFICNKGTLTNETTAATNYNLKMSNSIIGYNGGTWNIGTTGTPIPRDSSVTVTLDCGANVDYGIICRNGFTMTLQGLSRTSGKLFDRTLLNTDEAANSTSLGVADDTGWLDNDVIAVASTTRTSTQCEHGTLNGNAGASSLTVDGFAGTGGGVLYAHGGTSPVQAEVILLTRNVLIQGASASLQSYVLVSATATIDWDWYALRYMGSNTANKRGFETACTTGSQTFDYGSHYDFVVSGSRGFSMTGTSGTGLAINNYVSYNIAQEHYVNAVTTGTSVFNSAVGLLNTVANVQIYSFSDVGGTITNITAVGCTQIAILFTEAARFGTISNITSHSNANSNISIAGGYGTISGIKTWRSTANGLAFNTQVTNSLFNITINDLICFGNSTQNIRCGNGVITFNNALLAGDTTFSTTNGVSSQSNAGSCIMTFNGSSFSPTSGIYVPHTTADFNLGALYPVQVKLSDTTLAASTEVATQSSLPPGGWITSQKHDKTKGLHKIFKREGTLTIDTTTTQAGGFSMKMQPLIATEKLTTEGLGNLGFQVAVADATTVTPAVYVYEDSPYNGNRARLVGKRNDALGLTADVVLDTATASSDLAWEQLTGTSASVTDDGTYEFYVDCDGTAGALYVDTVTVA
jgi:hypothetical protein